MDYEFGIGNFGYKIGSDCSPALRLAYYKKAIKMFCKFSFYKLI